VCKESSNNGRELMTEEKDFAFGQEVILNVIFVAFDKFPA